MAKNAKNENENVVDENNTTAKVELEVMDETPDTVEINGTIYPKTETVVRRKQKSEYFKGVLKLRELKPKTNRPNYEYNLIFTGLNSRGAKTELFFNFNKLPADLTKIVAELQSEDQEATIAVKFEEHVKGVTTFEYDGAFCLDQSSGWQQTRIFNIIPTSLFNDAKGFDGAAAAREELATAAYGRAKKVMENPENYTTADYDLAVKLIVG